MTLLGCEDESFTLLVRGDWMAEPRAYSRIDIRVARGVCGVRSPRVPV